MMEPPDNLPHLTSLLSNEQLQYIIQNNNVAIHLEKAIDDKFAEFLTAKALLESTRVSTANKIEQLEKDLNNVAAECEFSKAKLDTETCNSAEIKAQLELSKTELHKTIECLNRRENDAEEFRKQRDLAIEERDAVLNRLERRESEMEHIKTDTDGLTRQLQAAINAKCEALARIDEVHSRELELTFKERRLEQERTMLNARIQSLTEELNRSTAELQSSRLNQSSRILTLETQLYEKTEELNIAKATIVSLEEAKKALTENAESLSKRLLEQREMENKMCQNFKNELDAKAKLADLYKNMQDDSDAKSEEFQEGIRELQKMLDEATEKYGELETKYRQLEADNEELIEKKNLCIDGLKRELENANDLLQASKSENLNAALGTLSPSAAIASKYIKSGMSLTEIYSQLVRVTNELSRERQEKEQLDASLKDMVRELEENAPTLRRIRRQNEEAIENNAALSQQVETLTADYNRIRSDYAESTKLSSHYQRENHRLKTEMTDLGRQVCYLLGEVERSRGNSFPSGDSEMNGTLTDSTAGSSENSSSRVISKNLVTFGNVDELQANNQKLLKLVRELTDQREDDERLRDEMNTGELQSKLEWYNNRVTELTEAQDRQTKMVNGLIRQRDMYKKLYHENMKAQGQDVSVNLDRSDSSFNVNDSINKSAASTPQVQNVKSADIEKLETQLTETRRQLDQQKQEYKTYKEVMIRNEKNSIEQHENMQKKLTQLNASYAKCVSQSEYNTERYKILQTNVTTYKKQIASLEEKNKVYSSTIAKHEVSLKHLRDEALNAHTKLSKAEVILENIQQECKFLKEAEKRWQTERDLLMRERQSQNLLMNNIELIKVSMERNEGESRIRLESRLDEANRECAALRRRLQEEQDRFRDLASNLERQTAQAKAKMEEEKSQADLLRNELNSLREELNNKSSHIEDLSKKLSDVTNPIKLTDSQNPIKSLQRQVNEKDSMIKSLQEQINMGKEHIKQYCDISECAEKELKKLNDTFEEYKKDTESKLSILRSSEQQLKERCSELEAELSLQSDGRHETLTGLKSDLVHTQEKEKQLLTDLAEKIESLNKLRDEYAKLSEALQSAEDKYGHEMVLHSNDIQALTQAKEQIFRLQNDINQLRLGKEQAENALNESKDAWKDMEKMLVNEKAQLEERFTNMGKQNALLLDQIQSLSTQLALVHSTKPSDPNESTGGDISVNKSFTEDEVRSSEQLVQVIKYLRKEQSIVTSKFDIIQAENIRIKSQLEVTEQKLDEAKIALANEREKCEINSLTLSKHSEVLRKVETLNAITDSNRILREERDGLVLRVNELAEVAKKLEESMSPLQEKNRELTTKVECLHSENVCLKAETTRWRTRVNSLVERANKTSPEDWKRLQNERETLAKMLTTEKENIKRLNEEALLIKLEKSRLEEQVNNLTKQHTAQAEELKKCHDEINTLKKDMAKITQDLRESKLAVTVKVEEIKKLNESITNKDTLYANIQNKELQIRKIAKKYKTQYEDLVKQVEEDKQKIDTETTLKVQSQKESQQAHESAVAEMERTHLEKIGELSSQISATLEENENLKKEIEKLNSNFKEADDKSKQLVKQARTKIVHMTEEKNNMEKEFIELKSKVELFEQNKEENDTRLDLLKSQYEGRLTRLEKEKNDLLQEKQQEGLRTNREMENLNQRITNLQRQLDRGSQQSAKPSTSSSQGDKTTSDPPTANIKPMSASVSGISPQQSVGGRRAGGETPFASIRPMASHAGARTAAVLPTTQPTSPAHPNVPTNPHHQTPHTTGSLSSDALSTSPSSSHHTTEYMPASSSAGGVRHLSHHARHLPPTPPESTQDIESELPGGSESASVMGSVTITPSQAPSAAQSAPQAVAMVIPRMEPPTATAHVHSDAPQQHHQHHVHHQQQASSSSSSNNSSSTVTTSHGPNGGNNTTQSDRDRSLKRPRVPPDNSPKIAKRTKIQGFQGVTESDIEYQVPTSSQRDQEDDGVIVVDSDEENYQDREMYTEEEEEDQEEEADDDVEAEEEEEDEGRDLGEEEEGEAEEEEDDDEEEGSGDTEEAGGNNEVEVIEEENSEEMPVQSGDADVGGSGDINTGEAASDTSRNEAPSTAPPPSRGQQIETITSGTEGTGISSGSLMLGAVVGGVGSAGVSGVYEEGDDSIVPSTPTLYVPRRNDGFGEAVSSPVAGGSSTSINTGRFTFGDGTSGGGGVMEDTHADLTAQLAPHHPTPQSDLPSITITGPEDIVGIENIAGSSEAELEHSTVTGGNDEELPTVSSQGSQPTSPQQQVEEGREAEASVPAEAISHDSSVNEQMNFPSGIPRGAMNRRNNRRLLRPTQSRPNPHHNRSPIVWGNDGDNRSGPYSRGMQRGGRPIRRPNGRFMRY